MIRWVQDNNTGIWHISINVYSFSDDTLCGLYKISTFISLYASPLLHHPEAILCPLCQSLDLIKKMENSSYE